MAVGNVLRSARGMMGMLALVLVSVMSPLHANEPSTTTANAESQEQFGAKVREYLLANPEVIAETLRILVQRQQSFQDNARKAALEANRAFLFDDPDAPIGGNPQGDVTIVEFFDYQCPHCNRAFSTIKSLLNGDPKIKIVYRELPVLGAASIIASRLALAAHRQGRYLDVHKALFTEPVTDDAAAISLGAKLGLDGDKLKRDMSSPEVLSIIVRLQEVAQHLGISGTPAFVIGDRILPGAVDLETLRRLVAEVRTVKVTGESK